MSGWPAWVPGLAAARRDGASWLLRLATARPLSVRVEVHLDAEGGQLAMVEGDLASARGRWRVAGGELAVDLWIELPVPLPGTLRRELTARYASRLLDALERAASAG